MTYFSHCKTLAEIKATYKQLAMEHHPDRGGDTTTMQAINTEYAFASALILKGANLSQDETEQEIRFSKEYRKIIEQIAHLPLITIELVGLWIWVTGNTYPIRKELKAAGLMFAFKKQVWYYRSEDLKECRGSNKTLDEIRGKYGSEEITKGQSFKKTLSEKK
jgi:hypothetical protein